LFVRSLVGLERRAAKQAFAQFIAGKTLSANQLEFVNHLTERGPMDPRLLYESPFTDIDPMYRRPLPGAGRAGGRLHPRCRPQARRRVGGCKLCRLGAIA
jgi:hypothetical protein